VEDYLSQKYGVAANADRDGDGLPDWWEWRSFGNLDETASGDPDGDGLTNLQEYQRGSDPLNGGSVPDTQGLVSLKVFTWLE